MPSTLDPVLAAVIRRKLQLIAHEMGLTLLRTTRSPVFHQAKDFATGLFDARGRILEQAQYIPLLGLSLQPVCRSLMACFGDDIHEGDVFVHNDVFTGGNQLSDIAVFRPVFHRGQLIAWAGCKGHQADIGGAVCGGVNPAATEVWQEGMRIPPLKIFDRGVLRRDVWSLLMANVRLPVVEHDLMAQVGSCLVGVRGLAALVDRYGLTTFLQLTDHLLDATERRLRQEIRRIPPGDYRGEAVKYLRAGSRRRWQILRVCLTVRVHDGELEFDTTGTDPETRSYVNAPLATTVSALLLALRLLLDPDLPLNEGMLRPLRIHVPEGTLLNPRYPAATAYGNHLTDQVAEAMFRALAAPLPQRVCAGWNRLMGGYISGIDPRRGHPYHDVTFLANKGGSGAVCGADGYDHIGSIEGCGTIQSQDYEHFELQNPVLLQQHEFWTDSAGAGQWRGGLGVVTSFRFEGDDNEAVLYGDGLKQGAFGLFGGRRGARNGAQLTRPDGSTYVAASDDMVRFIPPGSTWAKTAGGGGGYGRPSRRPAERVAADVRNGYVSVAAARAEYRVAVDPVTLELDANATAAMRRRKHRP